MQDNSYNYYGNDPQQDGGSYSDSPYAYDPAMGAQSTGTLPQGMDQWQMAGLLVASGVPFGKAMLSTAGMQQQANARAMQAYRLQIAQQRLMDAEEKKRAGNLSFDQFLNGNSNANPSIVNNPNASTLADLNSANIASGEDESTDPNSPNNIYTQMDDPNMVPAPNSFTNSTMPMTSGLGATPAGGGLTKQVKDMAKLMWDSGDKKGAIKYVQQAKAQAQGAGNGFQKNPMMGPSRGGQGGTYVNPQTQETVSSDTSANTTKDQATVAALQRVQPQVEKLMQVMPQFQHYSTVAKSYAQGVANKYLGADFDLPSQEAEGKAILESAPESLLKAYGLNVTDESLKSMRAMIKPGDGESEKGYRDRLSRNLAEMHMFGDQAKFRLANGINVTLGKKVAENPSAQQAAQMPSNQPQSMQPQMSLADQLQTYGNIQPSRADQARAILAKRRGGR